MFSVRDVFTRSITSLCLLFIYGAFSVCTVRYDRHVVLSRPQLPILSAAVN